MASPTPRRVRGVSLAVAVLALGAGCASGSGTDATQTAVPAAATGTATAPPGVASTPGPTPEASTPEVSTRVDPTPTAPSTVDATPSPDTAPVVGDEPERLVAEVVSIRPHDPGAFTQGLIVEDGRMFESTGDVGELGTVVREVDPATGEVVRETAVDGVFGEGLEMVDDRLLQLTWRDGQLIVFDVETLEPVDRIAYEGEGWGLCLLGDRLAMSDGSDTLTFREPGDFSVSASVTVTIGGEPLERLNELECVDGEIWANVWFSDSIVRIDPGTGVVTGVVDTSTLDRSEVDDDPQAVLNGIAFDETTGTFLVTGKLWPSMFEVRFVPA